MLLPMATALVAALAQWPLFDRMLVPMDEGHLALAASWMLDGKALYRDIHTGIFPGVYLLTAGLFRVFGEDLLVTRVAALLVNVAIALVLFLVGRRMLRVHWALVPPLLHLGLWFVSFPVLAMFNYSTLTVCLGLVSLLFALRYLERGALVDGLLLGFFIACAGLTKQNFGGLVFVALLVGFFWLRGSSALAERPIFAALWPVVVAGALPTFAVVGGFAMKGSLGELIASTLLMLGGSQMKDYDNPIPPLLGAHPQGDGRFLFLYLPPSAFNYMVHGEGPFGIPISSFLQSALIRASYGLPLLLLACGPGALFALREDVRDEEQRSAKLVVLFAVLFFPGIFPSAIWSHLAFVLIPLLPVFALVGDRLERSLRARAGPAAALAVRITAAGLALALLAFALRTGIDVVRWNPAPLALARASLSVSSQQADLLEGAVAFATECAAPDEAILAAPDIPAVYFLADRPAPTRFDLTIPGHVDGALIARRMEALGTKCVVFNPQMYLEFPPFVRLFPRLARYLSTHFERTRIIGGGETKWWGMERKRGAAP